VDRTRKTDKGLPHYCDGEGSGVFILSGADKAMTRKASQAGPQANLHNGPTLRLHNAFRPGLGTPLA
jgi:hypothetical protein